MASEFPCPHCGELVPAGKRFCKECGSDARIGWSQDDGGGLDLPEEMSREEYADYLAREFPGHPDARRHTSGIFWKAAAAVVVLAFLIWIVMR